MHFFFFCGKNEHHFQIQDIKNISRNKIYHKKGLGTQLQFYQQMLLIYIWKINVAYPHSTGEGISTMRPTVGLGIFLGIFRSLLSPKLLR